MKREHIWAQFFTSWLDAEGYEVDYCVNAGINVILRERYRSKLR